MFFTGAFNIDGMTAQKLHERDDYDDDVISRFFNADIEEKELHSDGYVSNKGPVATIHILPEYQNEENIEFIKRIFGLFEEYGVTEVRIVSFSGWDTEIFIKGINRGPFCVLNRDDCVAANASFVVENNPEGDIFQCAVHQAWLDMCRTLQGGSKAAKKHWNHTQQYLGEQLSIYFEGKPKSKEEAFDEWYYLVVRELRTCGKLTVGQAQKLINMAFKYLYCCSDIRSEKRNHFTCCHMPLDSYTLRWYKCKVDGKYDGEAWSKINDISKYQQIVHSMRAHLGFNKLLTEEFKIWQEEKRKVEIKKLISCANRIMKTAECSPELKELLDEYCEQL